MYFNENDKNDEIRWKAQCNYALTNENDKNDNIRWKAQCKCALIQKFRILL